jgi:hypothetical protein
MSGGIPSLIGLQQYTVDEEFYFVSVTLEVIFILAIIVLLIHSISRMCAEIRDPEYI